MTLRDARLEAFSTAGETLSGIIPPAVYPNHCHVNFPAATHRVRMLWDGGVTLDGRRPITPDRVDLFALTDATGKPLPAAAVLGLADLGNRAAPSSRYERDGYRHDTDNFLDVCLDLTASVAPPAVVQVLCSGPDKQISMPKGLRASPVHAPRRPPLCKPHAVNVTG